VFALELMPMGEVGRGRIVGKTPPIRLQGGNVGFEAQKYQAIIPQECFDNR
jgi:hypothetical protein